MWGILRIILLIASAGLLAIAVYHMSTERITLTWQGYALLTLFVLNFVYLLGHKGSDWRIFRLISLWFDAKENELRRRAGQDK